MQITAPRQQHLEAVTAEFLRMESRLSLLAVGRMAWVTTFGSGPFKQTLSWSEDLESERWRLLYSVFWQEKGPDPNRWVGRSSSRPVVDCPGDVRLRSHAFLGKLLRQLGVSA